MKYTMYQIDAFTDRIFGGNPAAVFLMDEWLPDELMQQIAMENNLSETAFAVKQDALWHIRWFTPRAEVALCGHATLATAYAIFNETEHNGDYLRFQSLHSGFLDVRKDGNWLILDFPADDLGAIPINPEWETAFGIKATEAYLGKTDVLIAVENEQQVHDCKPDFARLARAEHRGFILTAPGDSVDFVSRCFYPALGIDEDPVTGSAHTSLAVYWHNRTGKTRFEARQLSHRGGTLELNYLGDRVEIAGQAVKYMCATIEIPMEP